MADDVLIPYGDDASDTARKLLAAAEDLDQDPVIVVRHQPDDAGFRVPEDVATKAGFGEPDEPERDPEEDAPEAESKPAPRKRTTAKKTAAKKTASKS